MDLQIPSSALVFTVCLVLVITSAGNFKVSAAAQQYEAKTLEGGCPNINEFDTVISELLQNIGPLIEQETTVETPISPLEPCGGPGWRQVVFINMTDTSYDCPPGLKLTSYSKRTCGRAHINRGDCSSTTFSVGGSEYSRVCGRIRGYQVGSTSAFYGYLVDSHNIEGNYVDGVSLTHGPVGGRSHIWTFAAGLHELTNRISQHVHMCPCDVLSNERIFSPPFIGNDYFCESGLAFEFDSQTQQGVLFPNDPLWDGQNCSSNSTCCQLNNPPWFTKILPNPTTDDIEMCLCFNIHNDDTAIDLIELYVQ